MSIKQFTRLYLNVVKNAVVSIFPKGFRDLIVLLAKFKICSRNDLKLNECLRDAIQNFLLVNKDGIPELGIPRVDPVELSKTTMKGTPPYDYDQVYTNVKVYGNSRSQISNVEAIITDSEITIHFTAFTDKVQFVADYEFKDAFLPTENVTVDSTGICVVDVVNFKFDISLNGKITNVGQVVIDEVKISQASFDNLVHNFTSDDVAVSQLITLSFEESTPKLSSGQRGFPEMYADAYKGYANLVFSKLSFEELFPKK
ncbi:hypothetical protein RI129_013099 [Pyrocoelia pectoralis]|uniref:Uncharacterized protein n=1 Tax=Pyrocoelia pectoralis TaxID=417401 RepID=A0AAN7V7L1_9COLE